MNSLRHIDDSQLSFPQSVTSAQQNILFKSVFISHFNALYKNLDSL